MSAGDHSEQLSLPFDVTPRSISLAATLQALKEGTELLPSRTELPDVEGRTVTTPRGLIVAVASSGLGSSIAVVLRIGWAG